MRKESKTTYFIELSDGGELSLSLDGDDLTIARRRGFDFNEGVVLPLTVGTIRELHDAINEIEREVIGE